MIELNRSLEFQDKRVAFDDFLTRENVKTVERIMTDRQAQKAMDEHSYRVAERFFSYEVLEEKLRPLLRRAFMYAR